MTDDVAIHPVDTDRWPDMEALFEARGSPHYCWCVAWRPNEFRKTEPGKGGRKAAMKARVEGGVSVGLLAYRDGEPVAWCSVAPKTTYKTLGAKPFTEGVWSIACFFVRRRHRGEGLVGKLIAAAIEHARGQGAAWLEGYPVAPDSPTYRFMGVRPAFEAAGFTFVEPAGHRRNVMRLKL